MRSIKVLPVIKFSRKMCVTNTKFRSLPKSPLLDTYLCTCRISNNFNKCCHRVSEMFQYHIEEWRHIGKNKGKTVFETVLQILRIFPYHSIGKFVNLFLLDIPEVYRFQKQVDFLTRAIYSSKSHTKSRLIVYFKPSRNSMVSYANSFEEGILVFFFTRKP